MSQIIGGGFMVVVATGATTATSGTSTAVAIPNDSSSRTPNYIRVTASNETFVKLGTSGVVATTNDILVQPADSVLLQVPKGITHIAYIQGTAAGQVNVVPLENS